MGFNSLENSHLESIMLFKWSVHIFEGNQGKSGLTEVVKTFKKVQDKYITDLCAIAPHVESLNRCVNLKSEYLTGQNFIPSIILGIKQFVKSKLGCSSIDEARQILKNYGAETVHYSLVKRLLEQHTDANNLKTQIEIENKLNNLGLDEDYIGLYLSARILAEDFKA